MGDPASRLGTVVAGKWTLEALLGEGGLGSVYRAKHKNGSKVAIKILHAERARRGDARWAERFEREARLANKVEHSAVVRVLDDGILDDGSPFLVSELIDGASLEEERETQGGTLPIAEVLEIADVLLSVLAQAHEKGIHHRDIKPANLMRTMTGDIKVLDFGLAREMGSGEEGLTSMDAIVGTVGFMAPEQAQGRWDLVDATTDLWAVGATLLKLAAGLDAHDAETPQTRLALAATKPVDPVSSRGEKGAMIPAPIAKVIDRAMAFTKADRYPDALSFRAALDRARCSHAELEEPDSQDEASSSDAAMVPPPLAPPLLASTSIATAEVLSKGRWSTHTNVRRASLFIIAFAAIAAVVVGAAFLKPPAPRPSNAEDERAGSTPSVATLAAAESSSLVVSSMHPSSMPASASIATPPLSTTSTSRPNPQGRRSTPRAPPPQTPSSAVMPTPTSDAPSSAIDPLDRRR